MDFEQAAVEASTPRSEKKKSRTASFGKLVKNRLKKSISSERGTGSISSSDTPRNEPLKKRFSLRHRRSKSRKADEDRGAVTDRPRRSMSVDDLAQIRAEEDEEDEDVPVTDTFMALDKEVKVPGFGDAEQIIQGLEPGQTEGLMPPETPIPAQRIEPRGDTRSSSSANFSIGNEEIQEPESKDGIKMEKTQTEEQLEAKLEEDIKELESLSAPSFDVPADATATIDAGIEETVRESFARHEEATAKEAMKNIDAIEAAIVQKEEKMQNATEDDVFMPAETKIKTRDIDAADLVAQPETEAAAATAAAEASTDLTTTTTAKGPEKPKRRRRFFQRKVVRRASIPVAALAVSLLFLILKK